MARDVESLVLTMSADIRRMEKALNQGQRSFDKTADAIERRQRQLDKNLANLGREAGSFARPIQLGASLALGALTALSYQASRRHEGQLMTPADVFTVISSAVIGLTVLARAEIVSPRVRSTYASNWAVRRLMDAVSVACVFVIFEVVGGQSVPDAVAWFFVLGALTSSAMLVSMFVHDGREVLEVRTSETRAVDVQDMKEAVADVVPPVVERSLEKVVTGFTEPAPDYDRLIRVDPIPPSASAND